MRVAACISALTAVLAIGCADSEIGDPIGDRIWFVHAGLCIDCVVELVYKDAERLQWVRKRNGAVEADNRGTLTPTGETELHELTAELAALPDFAPHSCAIADGADFVLELPHAEGVVNIPYCTTLPPPLELERAHAFFDDVVTSLVGCESSDYLTVAQCEPFDRG